MTVIDNMNQLKALYGENFKEDKLITCYDINGNPFQMMGCSYREVSALEGGYIITPSGQYINVCDFQEHDDVFSLYLNYYKGTPMSQEQWGSFECTKMLNDFGHIVYFGVKTRYTSEITSGNTKESQNYLKDERIGSLAKGYGVLSFPQDKNITNEQRFATQLLLFSNYKETNQRYSKKLDISSGNMETATVYSPKEMFEILAPNQEMGLNLSIEDLDYAMSRFHDMELMDVVKLNRVKKELSAFQDETNLEVKKALRELYLHIQNAQISTAEKTREFQSVINMAQSYQEDATVYGYMMGEHEKLKVSNDKLFFKMSRYQSWIQYLQRIKEEKQQVKR